MLYLPECLKNPYWKGDPAVSENPHQVSTQEYHDDRGEEPENSCKERIDIHGLPEKSKQSSKESKAQYPGRMKEDDVFPIAHVILRGLC